MLEKIKKNIYKLNFKKTWPYFLAQGLLFAFVCLICEVIAFGVQHYTELSFLDEEFMYGFSKFTAIFFFWGFLCCYLVCRLIECLFKFFSECINKRMRKDDK